MTTDFLDSFSSRSNKSIYKIFSLIHKQNKVSSGVFFLIRGVAGVSVQKDACLYDLVRVGHFDVVIDPRRPDSGLAGPRIDFGTGLARAHVADAGFVPQVAYLRVVAALGTVLWGIE